MLKKLKTKNMGLFNKPENWWLRVTIVVLTISLLGIFVTSNKQTSVKISDLENQNDSLRMELFNHGTVIGRYEITLEILKERDSLAAAKFETILSTETE